MPTEGALAPDPLARLIPARMEPVREIPGRRKREPAWKDEVRQRVRRRRAERLGTELPLFPEGPMEASPEGELDTDLEMAPPSADIEVAPSPADVGDGPRLVWSVPGANDVAPQKVLALDVAEPPVAAERWSLGDGDETLDDVLEPPSYAASTPRERAAAARDDRAEPAASAVERPAQWTDRLQAAAFDLGLLASLWAVVLYFASRAARVSVDGLWVSWPYLVGYLGFLGVVYAVYFTGTCGRTVGKLVCGLKVVDVAGNPPSYPKALARVILGTAGALLGMLGLLPIFFDPARRAAHDRLLRTRVVKY